MRIKWVREGARWDLSFVLAASEGLEGLGQGRRPIALVTDSCRFELPVAVEEPHPDLLALAAWTVLSPWVRTDVAFDRPVSRQFAEVLNEQFGVSTSTIDERLSPRQPSSRAALSFSGGVDSTAVSTLLPTDTPHIFLRRVDHPRVVNRATHIRADVMERIVEAMGDRGLPTQTVKTDLHYLMLPSPDYPDWAAVLAGCLLMADHEQLGAVATGTTLGARYLANGIRFVPGSRGPSAWPLIFVAAGIPLLRPAAGMTEVATSMITQSAGFADIARSCGVGPISGPCQRCPKCVRKELIEAAIARRPINPALSHNIDPATRGIKAMLDAPPGAYQNIVEYALARIPGIEGTMWADTALRLRPTEQDTLWVERYWRPAIEDEVPEAFRPFVVQRIAERLTFMDEREEEAVESWDAALRGHESHRQS